MLCVWICNHIVQYVISIDFPLWRGAFLGKAGRLGTVESPVKTAAPHSVCSMYSEYGGIIVGYCSSYVFTDSLQHFTHNLLSHLLLIPGRHLAITFNDIVGSFAGFPTKDHIPTMEGNIIAYMSQKAQVFVTAGAWGCCCAASTLLTLQESRQPVQAVESKKTQPIHGFYILYKYTYIYIYQFGGGECRSLKYLHHFTPFHQFPPSNHRKSPLQWGYIGSTERPQAPRNRVPPRFWRGAS